MIDDWEGWLDGDLVKQHMTRKYRYVVQFRASELDISEPDSVSAVPVHLVMRLRDGVQKTVDALVPLTVNQ